MSLSGVWADVNCTAQYYGESRHYGEQIFCHREQYLQISALSFINIVKLRLQDISPNITELYVKNEILHKMIFLTRCQYFHGWKLCLQVFRTERVGKESGQVRWDVWWWSSYRQLWWWQWQQWWKLFWSMFLPSPPMLTMLIMRSKDAIRICFDLEW